MTMSSPRHDPLFDVHPVTGASVEVFYADTSLTSFGGGAAGWFWQVRRAAYWHALNSMRFTRSPTHASFARPRAC